MSNPETVYNDIYELWRYQNAMKISKIVKKELLSKNSKFFVDKQFENFDPYLNTLCSC